MEVGQANPQFCKKRLPQWQYTAHLPLQAKCLGFEMCDEEYNCVIFNWDVLISILIVNTVLYRKQHIRGKGEENPREPA